MEKIEEFLDHTTESSMFSISQRLLIRFGNSPTHLKMAYFGLLWGLMALVTEPFAFPVYRITNKLAPSTVWGSSIGLASLFHLTG